MFQKILVANRGEIAVRVIRACREMGIATVAVYSEADRRALHVRLADEALPIGPAPAVQSYLAVDRILQAAHQSGAQAIHPGYGFLSENADFARSVRAAGLVFIGPPPEAMDAMGDKGRARSQMQAAGVPVVPGYQGQDDEAALRAQAGQIGYPLLVKAAAGGGGKGMRVVHDSAGLDEAVQAARREAQHAFSDDRLILERYIPRARHIEFQVLADIHGNIVHLFERECSIQRRHQKIIEETPSPYLDSRLRASMGEAAVAAARAAGYHNAGTIEFIVDPDLGSFYFLEMNTRLQVEHPVTEWVTGLDLVQWQIRIAAGEALPFTQQDLSQRGHAIECRLYAEDPANNFLPATGPLLRFAEPAGPGVRVDSGFSTGDEITIHYDPLIAKIITWAADRPSAIRKMAAALRDTVLLGVTHNGQFLQDLISTPEFEHGDVYTTWVEEHFGDWQPPTCKLPPEVLAAAALTHLDNGSRSSADTPNSGPDAFSPWQATNGFRLGGHQKNR
jgi:3-methylcrotonyl-CoA carboxylase alpha subunit